MSKEKKQYWGIRAPGGGTITHISQWRKHAQNRLVEALTRRLSWRWFYGRGWRCVKVWVYQEPRELPATSPIKVYPTNPGYDLDIQYKPLTKEAPHA